MATIDASTTAGLIAYYSNLLVKQYRSQPNAIGVIESTVTPIIMPQTSVQTITFDPVPTGGSFVITYGDNSTGVTINWNDSAATIQSKIGSLPPEILFGGSASQSFSGNIAGGGAYTTVFQNLLNGGSAFGFTLSGVTVSGSIASGALMITFAGVTPPALLLDILSNALTPDVLITVSETDQTLPLAVMNGYQLTGDDTAVGVQLDVLGKYQGVTRNVSGFTTAFMLDDSDFLQLILLAIVRNNSGSSLADITGLLFQFFPGTISVIDFADMFMHFEINSTSVSENLVQAFISEDLLPVPMGVGYDIVLYDANPFVFYTNPIGAGFGDSSNPASGGDLAYVYT